MKQAWKEYVEILKLSWKWMIRHWKGYSLFTIILCFVTFGYGMWFDDIKQWFRNKFKKTTKEES